MKRRVNVRRVSLLVGVVALFTTLMFPLGATGLSVPALSLATPVPAGSNFKLGASVGLNGSVSFGANESKIVNSVALDMTGIQACDATLPVQIVSSQLVSCDPAGSGHLKVTVTHQGLTVTTGASTGNVFTAGPSGGSINYKIFWNSPVLLDPAPTITLLPQTSKLFDIPVIPTPIAGGGAVPALPQLTEKYPIPDLNALGLIPTAEPGLPPALPVLTEAFNVPLIPQPNAEGGLSELPAVQVAFSVPVIPTPTAVAGLSELPEVRVAWAIPTLPTPTAVAGVQDMPSHGAAFNIPLVSGGTQVARSIATDGTNFYLIVDDDGSEGTPKDKIIKVNSSGQLVEAFDTDGVVNGSNNNLTALAYINVGGTTPTLFVFDNQNRKIDKYNATTGASLSGIANSALPPNVQNGDIRGMSVEGTTRLWLARQDGCYVAKITISGSLDTEYYPNPCGSTNGLSTTGSGDSIQILLSGDDKVRSYTKSGNQLVAGQSFTFSDLFDIQGLEFSGPVLYIVDSFTTSVRKASVPHGVVIEGTPKDMTPDPDGIHLWMLIDATPKDKIAKIKASDGSLVASFDGPNSNTTAIDYFSNFLWVAEKTSYDAPTIRKINPANGNQTASITPERFSDPIGGMTNNGSDLVIASDSSYERSVRIINEANGTEVANKYIQGGTFTGGKAIARKSDGTYFIAKNDQIDQIDSALTGQQQGWQTNPSLDIQGASFIGNIFYLADATSSRVYQASIPHGIEVTKNPLGMTYDGTNLWMLIDAEPKDYIAKIDPANGTLLDSFKAPSNQTFAIAHMSISGTGFLWVSVTENSQTTIRKIDLNTKTQVGSLTPESIYSSRLSGLDTDGTKLIAVAEGQNTYYKITVPSGATEMFNPWERMQGIAGGNALVRRSGDGKYFVAKDSKIFQLDSILQHGLQNFVVSEPVLDIQGLAFVGSALYIADAQNDKVYKAAVPTGIEVTTDPLGLAYDGSNLWVLIDASPLDKIAKISSVNGAFLQAIEVGSSSASGITYLDNHLWVAEKSGYDPLSIRKISPTTGQEVARINPQNVHDPLGGLANDGNKLIGGRGGGSTGFGNPCFWEINRITGATEQKCPFGQVSQISGVEGLERASSGNYLAAQNNTIVEYDSTLNFARRDFTASTPVEMVGLSVVGNTIFVADTRNNKIYKTSLPSDFSVSTEPLGLTYDGSSLWVLIDATPLDKILKLIPLTGQIQHRFSAPDDDTEDIAFLNGSLYVAVNDNDQGFGTTRTIKKINTDDGAVQATLSSFDVYSDIVGLGKRGNQLIVTQRDGNQIFFKEPTNGNTEQTLYPPYDMPNGLRDVVILEGEGLFGVKDDRLFQLDEESGFLIQQFTDLTPANFDLHGIAGVGDLLYFADAATDKIYTASIPVPPTEITRLPKGITSDGTSLFIVVEANPKDKIIKLNTSGQFVTSFGENGVADAPSNNTDAIDYFDGKLWVLTSDPPPSCPLCFEPSRLRKLDPATGAQLETINLNNFGFFEVFKAMTNDGSKIIVGTNDFWVLIDPAKPSGAQRVYQNPAGDFPFMYQFGSLQFVSASNIGFWGVSGNLLNRFDKNSGLTNKSMNLDGVLDATGLAYVGTTLYVADLNGDQDGVGEVRGSTFIENRPEFTAAGAYTARLQVSHGGGTNNGSPVSFNLVKVSSVTVDITSPANNAVVDNQEVVVGGIVDDPSINKVLLGGEAGVTIVFQHDGSANNIPSNVSTNQTNNDVKWHVDTNSIANSPGGAWHYAKDVAGAGDYDTPDSANSGNLVIRDLVISEGTRLSFKTWYNTEGHPGADRKLIEINIVGDVPDVGWQALGQIVSPGFDHFVTQPSNAHDSFEFIPVQLANREFIPPTNCPPDCFPTFSEIWTPINIDFDALAGRTVDVRFRFDTVGDIFNTFEGWYVDDIRVQAKGQLPSANVVNGAFSANISLKEGSNLIQISAVNSYTFPALTGQDQVTVFRDTLAPVVNIVQDTVNKGVLNDDKHDQITTASQINITGSFVESKFATLLMTNNVGGVEIPILALTTPPTNNDFNQSVTLFDGKNRIKVEVTDTAGRTGVAEALILRDASGPVFTVLPTVYTRGVVSARSGDPIIFQLNAFDTISDVKCVEVIFPGPGNNPAPCASTDPNFVPGQNTRNADPFRRPQDIPQAVRDTWGTTGQWLLPLIVPTEGTLPGSFDLEVRLTDLGNNTTFTNVKADIVPALSAINIGLMPNGNFSTDPGQRIGSNLISLPLIPDDRDAANLPRLLGKPTNVTNTSNRHEMNAMLSPDGRKIVFASDHDTNGSVDIFVTNLVTKATTRLTGTLDVSTSSTPVGLRTLNSQNLDPSWSPDGSKIVFVSDRDSLHLQSSAASFAASRVIAITPAAVYYSPQVGFFDVFVMNADGSNVARLTDGGRGESGYDNFGPVFTPDGGKILWASDRGGDVSAIWRMDATGNNQVQLSANAPIGSLGHFAPRPSPDGTKVLYVSDEQEAHKFFDVFMMNMNGTGVEKLVDRQLSRPSPADWKPDGRWVGFVDRPGGETTPANIYAIIDGNMKQITYSDQLNDNTWFDWGMDNKIYYDQAVSNFFDLFTVEPRLFLLTEAIWAYDATKANAPEGPWVSFRPDAAPDTLMKLETGRGYWWLTDSAQFQFSAPLAPGLPQTPKVENFAYNGVFLRAGSEAPPTYVIKQGWNLIGLHQERPISARNYLAALGRGDQAGWSSLLVFDNFVDFPFEENADPLFELGHFTRKFENDLFKPGQGGWLFSTVNGSVTP